MSAAPGPKQYPGHRIAVKPAGVHVQVKYAGETIADTHDAVALEEAMSAGSSTVPISGSACRSALKLRCSLNERMALRCTHS